MYVLSVSYSFESFIDILEQVPIAPNHQKAIGGRECRTRWMVDSNIVCLQSIQFQLFQYSTPVLDV